MSQNKAHLTAIKRKSLSVPMRYLSQNDLIMGHSLDFGCGRGFDAESLKMDQYDPYWRPAKPSSKYETITCNYVLNVIQDENEIRECLKEIQDLLLFQGKAYITVRRDIKESTISKRGTFQRPVYLNLRSIKKTSTFETYELTCGDDLNLIQIASTVSDGDKKK